MCVTECYIGSHDTLTFVTHCNCKYSSIFPLVSSQEGMWPAKILVPATAKGFSLEDLWGPGLMWSNHEKID